MPSAPVFNTTKPPLDNVKVRQALSYAIPYEDIIKIAAQGMGTQSRGPVPAGVWPWSADVKQYTQDMEKAKALLKEAGFEKGGFSINLTYASENASEEAFAPLIKDAFAELGVDVTLTPMEFNQQWELAKADPAKAQDMFLVLDLAQSLHRGHAQAIRPGVQHHFQRQERGGANDQHTGVSLHCVSSSAALPRLRASDSCR